MKNKVSRKVRVTQWLSYKDQKFCEDIGILIEKNYGDTAFIEENKKENKIALFRRYSNETI